MLLLLLLLLLSAQGATLETPPTEHSAGKRAR